MFNSRRSGRSRKTSTGSGEAMLRHGYAGLAVPFAAASAVAAPLPAHRGATDVVVVTGERAAKSLKQTSSSVAVVTAPEIVASGAKRVDDVLAAIPNVQLGNGSEGPAIRGQDTTGALQALPAFLGGNRPRATLIVDGRAVTYNEFVFGTADMWDLDRIEVFRTPQTTTQGRNSIAGAIFVDSKDPTFTPEYRARLIAGDFRERQGSVLASGPLIGSEVGYRIAADYRTARTSSRIVDEISGANPNHDRYGVLRAKLLVNPSALPGTRVLLTYMHTQSQSPQIVGVSAPFRRRRDELNGYGVFRINVDSATAQFRQAVSEHLATDVTLTIGDSKTRRLAIRGLGETRIRGRDWSAEAVMHWSSLGPISAVAGVSRVHQRLDQSIDLSLLSGLKGAFGDSQDGVGLFGEATFDVAPRASLTAGARYQRDRQTREGALAATSFGIPADFTGTFHAWLPKLSFAYDFSPAVRAGFLLEKAYNPGGTTIRVDTLRRDDFAAETLWDYEAFVRAGYPGARITAQANLFYYTMRHHQAAQPILLFTPSGMPVGFADLVNLPRGRSYGLEAAVNWSPTRTLTARAGVGLLRTKITQTDPDTSAFQDRQFARSPHLTASATVDWRATRALRISAQVRHHTGYFSDNTNSPELHIGSGTSVNGRAEYEVGRVSLFGEVRNLFDRLNMVDLQTPFAGEAEDPRTVSIGVEVRF